jgi:peptidoglycan/xylan/chitin deacetylase (PgdA/CDA1 family)
VPLQRLVSTAVGDHMKGLRDVARTPALRCGFHPRGCRGHDRHDDSSQKTIHRLGSIACSRDQRRCVRRSNGRGDKLPNAGGNPEANDQESRARCSPVDCRWLGWRGAAPRVPDEHVAPTDLCRVLGRRAATSRDQPVTDVLVLCYHAVSPSWEATLSVTPDDLERQVGFLLSRGWRATTFSEAALNPTGPRMLAITFDDAFASVYRYAVPILASLGVPGTVFAPTAYIRTGTLGWAGIERWQNSPSVVELKAMSWDDLGGLAELGWEIGSHTQTHPHLTQLDSESLALELEGSRQDFADQLGRPSEAIAYPYGDVDARVAQRVASAGYRAGAALSSQLKRLGPYRHPRVGIYHEDAWWRFRLKTTRPLREVRASRAWAPRAAHRDY